MADRYDTNIDAFWDSRNGQAGATPVLDAELAATIQQLHTLYASSPPSSTRERVRQRVLDKSSFATENAPDMHALALPVPVPARPAPRAPSAPTIDRRSFWIALAAAAVILFASLGGWLTYERLGGTPSAPAVIPAVQDATPTTAATDWPMYRGNPGRTGAMPGTGPKTAPGVVWSALLDGSAYRSPMVAADTAFVGTAAGTLYALDAASGAERWRFTGDASLETTPAYQDGIVYVPSQLGTLYAIDAETGNERWRFAEPLAEFATPTFGDGLLFAGSATGNALYGVDPATGAEVWHYDTESAITRGQAYADGVLFSGSESGVVYALNASDGTLVWQQNADPGGHGTPAVVDGVLYTTTADGALIQIDTGTGDEVGRIETGSTAGITPPTVGDGKVYFGNKAGSVDAIDLATSQIVWSHPIQQPIQAAVALVDGVIYAATLDGAILALDAETGAELWAVQVNGAMDFGPTIANGLVYASTDSAEVIALGDDGSPATPVAATSNAGDGASPVASSGFDQSQITLLQTITGPEDHPLLAPQGVAIAPNGDIYVVSAVTDTVEIFSPNGSWLDSLGGTGTGPGQFRFHKPGESTGIGNVGFDADGNLYVFDLLNNRVQKFASDHTFLLEWGTLGKGNGQFEGVTGSVDARTGRVFVTDINNRVQVFDLDGTFLDKWGSTGSGPSKFQKPTDVVVDSEGNVYIGEESNHRVQKFDQYGAFLDSTGSIGTMEGDIGEVFALAVDADDNLFIADFTGDAIHILSPDGTLIGTIDTIDGPVSEPSGLAIGPDGALYVVEEGNNRILELTLPPLGE